MSEKNRQPENAHESTQPLPEILIIDKPFLTRPHFYAIGCADDADSTLPLPIYQQIELLREALRPFAELGDLFHAPDGEKAVFSMNFSSGQWRALTVNDFRRAISALADTKS